MKSTGDPSIELAHANWRKSSMSQANGACVEISDSFGAVTSVRDSKDPHGPVLAFPASGWMSFIAAVKDGDLTT